MFCFFFNDTATTEIYTLSLHDALPISKLPCVAVGVFGRFSTVCWNSMFMNRYIGLVLITSARDQDRSEEHTSELQSRQYLVCRLLLEKKKKYTSCHD